MHDRGAWFGRGCCNAWGRTGVGANGELDFGVPHGPFSRRALRLYLVSVSIRQLEMPSDPRKSMWVQAGRGGAK